MAVRSPDTGSAFIPDDSGYKHPEIIEKLKQEIEGHAGRWGLGYTLVNIPMDFVNTGPNPTVKPEQVKNWALQKGIDKLPRHIQAIQKWDDEVRDEVASFLVNDYRPQIEKFLSDFPHKTHTEREFQLKEALVKLTEKPS